MAQTKYPLPDVVDPPERLCIQINIPNEPGHRAAFAGAIYNLTRWYSWKEDSAQTAKAVADVWLTVWNELQENFYDGCEGGEDMGCDVRQNTEAPCILEKDCGDGWVPFANLQACPPNIRLVGGVPEWFNPTTGQWEPTAGGAQAPKPAPRPETGDDAKRCAAAANAAEVFRALHHEMAALITDPTNTPLQAAAVLVAIIASLFIIPVLVAALMAGILAMLALSYAWDTTDFDLIYDRFVCILYCHSEVDAGGRVTFNYFNVLNLVTTETGGSSGNENLMWIILTYYLGWVGADGLNLAGGVQAGATFNCSECDECEQLCEGCGTPTQIVIQAESASVTGGTGTGSGSGRTWRNYNVGQTLTIDLGQEVCLAHVFFTVNDNVAGTSSKQFDIGLDDGFIFQLSWTGMSSGWFERRAPGGSNNFHRRTRYITYKPTGGVGGALDAIRVIYCPLD